MNNIVELHEEIKDLKELWISDPITRNRHYRLLDSMEYLYNAVNTLIDNDPEKESLVELYLKMGINFLREAVNDNE